MSRAERVVVALTGGPEGEVLLRRAAGDGELHSVYVVGRGPRAAPDPTALVRLRALTEELGGTHHTIRADDPAAALLDFARGIEATRIVIGVSRRGRVRSAVKAGVSDRVAAGAEDIDVLIVSHPYARGAHDPRRPQALSRRRVSVGAVLAVGGPLLLTVLPGSSGQVSGSRPLTFLALTVLVALVGGLWPAVVSAALGSVLLNFFFVPPLHTLTVANPDDLVTLLVFLVVAVAVASVVDLAARRSVQADLSRREADLLSMLNRAALRSEQGVDALLALLCETFSLDAATLLESGLVVASCGEDPPTQEPEADMVTDVADDVRLMLRGRTLPPHDLRVLTAFATHLAVVLERQRLAGQAADAVRLEQGNKMRTALLAALSHDLRTPLAGVKAAVSTLRTADVSWSDAERAELLEAIEESSDRLAAIIANLLDLTRLQTGGVTLSLHDVGLDDVAAGALRGLTDVVGARHRVHLAFSDELPAVRVDAGLLERVVANLLDNALRHSASDVEVTATTGGDQVVLSVVDHGPGVPEAAKATMFEPFQRLGDAPAGEGVGLGLAVARGLTEVMGGALVAEDTDPQGLTMTVVLPAAPHVVRADALEAPDPAPR